MFPVQLYIGQCNLHPTNVAVAGADETRDVVDPLTHPDYFGVADLFTMRDLFDARAHIGHKVGVRNAYVAPYIFGSRLGVDIIDLEQTTPRLVHALNFAAHVAYRGGVVLFVSRNPQTLHLVERTAAECGEYAHCRFWKGGSFTNATVQFAAVTRLPDVCVFISTHDTVFEQHTAVAECAKMNIPTIGIIDSSCDPRLFTYPVPGNDDTPAAVQLYCRLFKEAILAAKAKRKEATGETV